MRTAGRPCAAMARSDSTNTLARSDSENGDELLDPEMLSLPGDKTTEEARLEREGCIRDLQVFRYNLYKKGHKGDDWGDFAHLIFLENALRVNCQTEIAFHQGPKTDTSYWIPELPSFEEEMNALYEDNWMRTRAWWHTRGTLFGISGPLKWAFELWRSDPLWYMHPVLVEDCKSKGGCCGRNCGCCRDAERKNTSAGPLGVGHCTPNCHCCRSSRGFELSEKRERFLADRFSVCDYHDELRTVEGEIHPYHHRIFLAYFWGIQCG
ncbi:unnamed protein product [Penicillium olsonii]|nr:unnamed protein product [Penicillium olsonii]